MRISDCLAAKQTFSFEIFPPKGDLPIDQAVTLATALSVEDPDWISVTFSAGGSGNSDNTISVAGTIERDLGTCALAHLTCLGSSKADVDRFIDSLAEYGVKNVLALRGDMAPGKRIIDFEYATDLISYIKERNPELCVGAACYPEIHPESTGAADDLKWLRYKVDCGADHLITQLFLDNRYFFDFREKAAIAGIDAPIEAGIMPVTNKRQIERMVKLCGVELPQKFVRVLERYEHNETALRDAGIAYAIDQITDLIAEGVDGIHLYTMNNAYIAHRIYDAVQSLIRAECSA